MTHEQRKQQIIEILKEADTETGCIFRIDYEYTASEIATKQEEEMKRIIQLLKIAKCPDCDGSGGYAIANPKTGEPELQQCRWCFERDQFIKKHEQ